MRRQQRGLFAIGWTAALCLIPAVLAWGQSNQLRIHASELEKTNLTVHLKYLDKADRALLDKDYEKALANYFKCLTYAPAREKSLVWDDLGYIYMRTGELEKAGPYLADAIKSAPYNYNPRLYLAMVFLLKDDFPAAAEQLEAISRDIFNDDSWIRNPRAKKLINGHGSVVTPEEMAFLHAETGVLFYQHSHDSPEHTLCLDALDERNIPLFLILRGVVSQDKGEGEAAEADFRKAASLNSGLSSLSELAAKLKQYAPGPDGCSDHGTLIKVLRGIPARIAHSFDGHSTNVLWELNSSFLDALREGNLNRAEEILHTGLTVNGLSYEFNHNLALLAYDEGDLDTAGRYCVRALFSNPDSVGALDLLGNILYQKGDYSRARKYFSRVLELEASNEYALYSGGACSYYMKDFEEAERLWILAVKYSRRKDTGIEEKAENKDLSHEMTVRSKTITFLCLRSLGVLCFEKDRITDAVSHLEEALSLRPEDTETLFYLGKALAWKEDRVTAEDVRRAITHLEKHIYLGGKHTEEAEKLLSLLRRLIK